MLDRAALASFWEKAQHETGWTAPFGKAVDGLTAAQAAWKPAPERHSIWQIVNHLSFWREDVVRGNEAKGPASDELIERENWRAPASTGAPTEGEWRAAQDRFRASHEAIVRSLRETEWDPTSALHVISHDFYHVGQIMLLRAMQGLKPIE